METTQKLEQALLFIQQELGDVTVQQLLTLMYIVNNEGCPQVEISLALDMPEASVSRNITKLSAKRLRYKSNDGQIRYREGRNLLIKEVDDNWDVRRNVIKLSRKGKAFVQRLQRKME